MQKKCRENAWRIILNKVYYKNWFLFFQIQKVKIVVLKPVIQTDVLTGEPYIAL